MEPNLLQKPVSEITRQDFIALPVSATVEAALAAIRKKATGEEIIYFYVVDEAGRLIGVLPARRLLAAALAQRVSDLMVSRVIAVPATATVLDVCELFVCHRFLAFPVIDHDRRIVGTVDLALLTQEVVDVSEKERMEDLFQTLGFRVAEVQNASPFKAFRLRFPWLLATITGGTICAFMAGAYEATLAQSLVIAFFLTLVLGLAESVSAQSMTLAVQATHGAPLTWARFQRAFRKELATALLLGMASGLLVACVVWLWRHSLWAAAVIGLSIVLSVITACLMGFLVPSLLRRLKLDPKIAAGPVALALADIFTLLFYFNIASFMR